MKKLLPLLLAPLAACASSGEPTIVPRAKSRLAKASLLPGQSLPAERDGVRRDDTGDIMFVCANTDRHEDKEVFFSRCPAFGCGQESHFYWDYARQEYRCYACTQAVNPEAVKCPECGRPPRVWRTRPKPKAS
jgi:hypothetical protein